MSAVHIAYWLTPLLFFPVFLVWRLSLRTSHPGIKMVALQFAIIAGFDILVDCTYSISFQQSLIDNKLSEQYLMESFFASFLQYNIFAATLWFFCANSKFTLSSSPFSWYGDKERKFVEFVVLTAAVAALYSTISQVIEGGFYLSYGNALDNESIETMGSGADILSALINLGTLFSPLYIINNTKNNFSAKLVNLFAYFLITLFLLKMLTGARAALFSMVLFYLSAKFLSNKKIFFTRYSLILIVGLMLVVINFAGFSNSRVTGKSMSPIEAFINLANGFDSNSVPFQESLESFAWRTSGARMGAVLFSYVDTHGVVGPGAIVNNMYSFIPRILWPNKPNGNSIDGTVGGMATYQVSQILTGSKDTNNQSDSVSSAAVSYWILGWLGVVLSGFFSALVVVYIIKFTRGNNHSLPWIYLLGFTSGGWFIVADIGTWFNQLSRYGLIFLILNFALRVRLAAPQPNRGEQK